MNCQIYLWRIGKTYDEIELFCFVSSDDELPKQIRLVLPSVAANYIKRTTYFKDVDLIHKGIPVYREIQVERSSQP